MTTFEWDPRKNAANCRKHGVAFEDAASAFDDPQALVGFRAGRLDEDRWLLIGRMVKGTVVVVAFAVREHADGEAIRLISARRALKAERIRYEQQTY